SQYAGHRHLDALGYRSVVVTVVDIVVVVPGLRRLRGLLGEDVFLVPVAGAGFLVVFPGDVVFVAFRASCAAGAVRLGPQSSEGGSEHPDRTPTAMRMGDSFASCSVGPVLLCSVPGVSGRGRA
ncbi:hypothetical protein ACFVZH_38880, partial [Streptomyces sp. NPDC059534]|uniref:hypothetical protein n=1 Tax=Streptomyces sp. NPDC059534 TaxID=3346859 RepID=UPI0036B1C3CD